MCFESTQWAWPAGVAGDAAVNEAEAAHFAEHRSAGAKSTGEEVRDQCFPVL